MKLKAATDCIKEEVLKMPLHKRIGIMILFLFDDVKLFFIKLQYKLRKTKNHMAEIKKKE